MFKIKKNINDLEMNLKVQIGVLLCLGIVSLLLSYFSQTSLVGQNIMNLENEIHVVLNQLYISTYFISTLSLNGYRKADNNIWMFITYILIFISYVLQRNFIIVFLMSFYLLKLLRNNNKPKIVRELRKGESILAFSCSLIVFFTSILIVYINISF